MEECSENIDENGMIYNGKLNDHKKVLNSVFLFVSTGN